MAKVTAERHPQAYNRMRGYPDGIWYGCIDGQTATAPCVSKEQALNGAKINAERRGIKIDN